MLLYKTQNVSYLIDTVDKVCFYKQIEKLKTSFNFYFLYLNLLANLTNHNFITNQLINDPYFKDQWYLVFYFKFCLESFSLMLDKQMDQNTKILMYFRFGYLESLVKELLSV